jgi:predicted nucleotidyltransferase
MIFDELHYLAENTVDVIYETSTPFYNDTLHPEFWVDGKFDTGIREKLLRITSDFIQNRININEIDDIQLTGSMANFNYTEFSDLDVHVLTDFSKLNRNTKLVKQALDGKRFVWNLRHNIVIREHEVEMYFQDTHEPHIASGLFSLKHNNWIKTPVYDPPEIDDRDVNKKADSISGDIDRLKNEIDKDISPERAELYYKKAGQLKDKIRKMRQAGLESSGEFSIENLAFKRLRNSGDIGALIQSISDAYGKIYSEQNVGEGAEPKTGLEGILKTINDPLNQKRKDIHSLSNLLGKEKKGPRTQKWGTGLQRLHQNMMPAMHKVDNSLNGKVQLLKDKPAGFGKLIISLGDLQDISKNFSIKNVGKETTREDPKHLGSTGIMLYWDRRNQSYCIEK